MTLNTKSLILGSQGLLVESALKHTAVQKSTWPRKSSVTHITGSLWIYGLWEFFSSLCYLHNTLLKVFLFRFRS